jgi:hypothetical protein
MYIKGKEQWILITLAIIMTSVLLSCTPRVHGEIPIAPKIPVSREEAKRIVIDEIARPSKAPNGLRVHMYPELLPKGSKIVPFQQWVNGNRDFLVCDGDCWFFWFDDDPLAQFAHPTRLVILSSTTGKIIIKGVEWWPVVNNKVMWGKTEERMDDKLLIFEKPPKIKLPLDWRHDFKFKQPQTLPGCEAWVILICGSTDQGNTFDEDVQFLYNVFTGLGYDDAHIFYVSPWTTDPGVDRTTTLANVQWAINQVAINGDVEDKVFFFYSSHGGVDYLQCCPGEPGGGNVTSTDMDNWLDAITPRDMIILLQGCHTGSFIGYYSNGTTVASENELTGDGETNRIAMTATDTDHSSYGGPSNWGSTFTGGYIESFNDPAADVVNDGDISVDEAYTYAYNHDDAAAWGWSFPHMNVPSLDPAIVFHVCPVVDLWISDGANDIGYNSYDYNSTDIWSSLSATATTHEDPVSGLTNYVHVRIHNLGSSAANNVDVTLYWANTSTALAWPADFHQIGTTFNISTIPAGGDVEHTWSWYVDPALGTGHSFCFVATADCPDDPMTGGPPGYTYVAPYDNNIAQKNITIVEAQAGQSAVISFLIENNSRRKMPFDLVIHRGKFPDAKLSLSLTDELMKKIMTKDNTVEGLEFSKEKPHVKQRLLVTAKKKAIIRQIDLMPMERREVSFEIIIPEKAKVGDQFTMRIEQVANGEVIGANTFLVRIVSPGNCRSIMKRAASVYAQIAFRYRSPSAFQLVEIIGDGLKKGICRNLKDALKWKRTIFDLEKKIGDELREFATARTVESYFAAIKVLDEALTTGNLEDVVIAQGKILKLLEKLIGEN